MKWFLFSLMLMVLPAMAAPSATSLLQNEIRGWMVAAELDTESEFAKQLLSSDDWMRELSDSGPVNKPAEVLSQLHQIWEFDPTLAERPIDRVMATVCALEGPRRKWDPERVIKRYEWFRDRNQQGRLNMVYQTISPFQRRYVAAGVQHDHLNHLESLEYQNIEVCLPSEQYTGACWYARWILHNPFGDSIHGPKYYAPFMDSYESAAERIRKVGGVCGSLSNFGAAAAIANGIPAATMGEPGHCAYTVMGRPQEWIPSYSLSWKRGLHTSYHGGSWGWHLLNQKAHSDSKKAYASADYRRLARYYSEKKETRQMLSSLSKAREINPADWENWTLAVKLLTDNDLGTTAWQDLHNDLLKSMAPQGGEMAWSLLDNSIYPKVLEKGPDGTKNRMKALLAYHRELEGWGLSRWEFGRALDKQIKWLDSTPENEDRLILSMIRYHVEEGALLPVILESHLKRLGEQEKRRQTFIAELGKLLQRERSSEGTVHPLTQLARKILPDAAAKKDKSTFQFIGKLASKYYDANKENVKKFKGISLSSGGTLKIDKPGNRWDDPSKHWGVIEAHGGDFHTGSDKPSLEVQLGNFGRLTGIVIVTRGGNVGRLNGAILQTSINGEDWTDQHTFSKAQRVNRIDLADKEIDAGYIRIHHPGGQHQHYHQLHVYGYKKN